MKLKALSHAKGDAHSPGGRWEHVAAAGGVHLIDATGVEWAIALSEDGNLLIRNRSPDMRGGIRITPRSSNEIVLRGARHDEP